MSELDPKRLERAYNEFIDTWWTGASTAAALEAAIRAYLGPEAERELEVVEAAVEWVAAYKRHATADKNLSAGIEYHEVVEDLEDAVDYAAHDIRSAVAALAKEGGE